jgi:hypothetical protein
LEHKQLERAESSQILRFLTCDSVDDGRSKLIGRMLKDLDLVNCDFTESSAVFALQRPPAPGRPKQNGVAVGPQTTASASRGSHTTPVIALR